MFNTYKFTKRHNNSCQNMSNYLYNEFELNTSVDKYGVVHSFRPFKHTKTMYFHSFTISFI